MKRPLSLHCSICGRPVTVAIISEAGNTICVQCDAEIRKALKDAEDARK
jgi:predicted nucleic acid-binding Zn ribbon protein